MANATESGINMASVAAGSAVEGASRSANLSNLVQGMEGGSVGLGELARGAEAAKPPMPDVAGSVMAQAEAAPTPLEGIAAVASAPPEMRPGNLNLQAGDIPVIGPNGLEGVQRASTAAPATPEAPQAAGPATGPEAAAPAPGIPPTPEASAAGTPDAAQPKLPEAQAGAAAQPASPENQNAQPPQNEGQYFDDAENRRRQGEDLQVAQGEITTQQRDQARAERAPQVAQERADKQQAEQDRQRAEHKDLKELEAGGKPLSPEQQAKLLEYNKQEQGRKTDYDALKDRFDKGDSTLTPDDLKRLEALRGEFNPEKPQTPDQMKQQETDLVNKLVNGENVADNMRQLSELRDKMDGGGKQLTPEEAKVIADRLTGAESGGTEAQQRLRQEILEMMGIETQLVAQGAILAELRKKRTAAIAEARQAETDAKTGGHIATETDDPNKALEGNRKVYDAYFKVWMIKANITFTKLNAGRLVAEYYDKRQSVRRRLGVATGVEVVTDFIGAKLRNAGSEAMFQVNSVVSETVLDDDEPFMGSFAA